MSNAIHYWYDPVLGMYVECSSDEAWDHENGKQANMYFDNEIGKKSMDDTGTRFQFLSDFQDYLSDGLLAVNNSLARYNNDTDAVRKKSLESALSLLNAYQERLSGMERDGYALNNLLDSCAPDKKIIAAIREEVRQSRTDKNDSK